MTSRNHQEGSNSYKQRNVPILSDKDLRGFDEILDNKSNGDWINGSSKIDYNAKLVFSDDEDADPKVSPTAPTSSSTMNRTGISEHPTSGDLEKRLRELVGDNTNVPNVQNVERTRVSL